MRKKTPFQEKIPYSISTDPMDGSVTSLGGAAIVSRVFRSMDLAAMFNSKLEHFRRIRLGHTPGEVAETVLCSLLLGATCVEDIDHLQEDSALQKILGFTPVSVRSVRDWLEKFHCEEFVSKANELALEKGEKSSVPSPTEGLKGLQSILGYTAREVAKLQPSAPLRIATVDLDATIVESHKRSACMAYTGDYGYQPVVAIWAEANAILATEFRDGNVPAGKDPLDCARMAFRELPSDVTEKAFRGDSACDNQDLLKWLDDTDRADGPKGVIQYAVSARMNSELLKQLKALDETKWVSFGTESDGTIRQYAEVEYTPTLRSEKKDAFPRRTIGLRFLKAQGELFEDGNSCKHLAIITNRKESALKVIQWHREKAGTVEHVHDEMKNDLAAGRMPSQKFGANAAWFALNAIAFNLVSALRAADSIADNRTRRVRTVRYHLLTVGARISRLSRKMVLRFAASKEWIQHTLEILHKFKCKVQPTG